MKATLRDRRRHFQRKAAEAYEESWIIKIVSWLLLIGLTIALIRVAVINIQPYYSFMAPKPEDGGWIQYLPFFGWLSIKFGQLMAVVGGILLWSVVQIFQILWLIVALDRKAQRNAVKESRKFRDEEDLEDRDPRTRRIARKSKGIPYFFIRWAYVISLAAYAFDFALGLQDYPLAPSLRDFLFYLGTGFTENINMENFTNLLSMLFFFEVIAIPFVVVAQWVRTRNRED